jgi:hypothetical protein
VPSTASVQRAKKSSLRPTPEAKPTAMPKAAPNCNPPFTVDANGVKHAKPECL